MMKIGGYEGVGFGQETPVFIRRDSGPLINGTKDADQTRRFGRAKPQLGPAHPKALSFERHHHYVLDTTRKPFRTRSLSKNADYNSISLNMSGSQRL
jgi:hypothetical protein